jgi:hypothetical protein
MEGLRDKSYERGIWMIGLIFDFDKRKKNSSIDFSFTKQHNTSN